MSDMLSELTESKSFWCTKLIDAIAPSVIHKFRQIFEEAFVISNETKETRLYLKAFQNALNFIPEWSNTCIQKECQEIINRSKCHHLKELITTVHVIALKMVTNMRTNNKAKSVHINIPDIEVFIHRIYINAARQIWKVAFLYSKEVDLIEQQKNQYEIEKIIRGVIYHTIQDNIPAESFIRSYLAEDVEEDEEVIIEPIEPVDPIVDLNLPPPPSAAAAAAPFSPAAATSSSPFSTAAETTAASSSNTATTNAVSFSEHSPTPSSASSATPSSSAAPSSVVLSNVNVELDDLDLDLGLDVSTANTDTGFSTAATPIHDSPKSSLDDDLFDLNIEHV